MTTPGPYGSPYPGPIGAIISPLLRSVTSPIDASLPFASTLCGACYDVCPVAINIPEALVYLRAHHDAGSGDIVDLFAERVADYRAVVERVHEPDLPAAVARALSARA